MRFLEYLPDPFRALTGAFLARFFESEVTTGTDDLKASFFWLLAALAIPGMFIPWMMAFDWHLIAMYKGPVALREASQAEKVFYLGFSMIASGLLTTIVWSSLLPDRRDTLILGTLPVHPRTIVTAKLAALLLYILLVAISMHAIGSVFFGAVLSTNTGTLFAFRGMFAHFVASSAASAVVALMVAAAQGLTLTLFGPRLFRRATTLLQIVLVGLVTLCLALMPVMSSSVVHTLRGFGSRMQPWVLSTPPVWFMGLYEWLLGTSDPKLLALAARAGLTLLAAAALTVLTFPLAYRRLMVSVVETAAGPGRFAPSRLMRGALVLLSGRHPEARAAADFYVATIARVERHRFVIAIALGLSLAWSLPGLRTFEPSAAPAARVAGAAALRRRLPGGRPAPGGIASGRRSRQLDVRDGVADARPCQAGPGTAALRPGRAAAGAAVDARVLVDLGKAGRAAARRDRRDAWRRAGAADHLAQRRDAVRSAVERLARRVRLSLALLRRRLLRHHERRAEARAPALRAPHLRRRLHRPAGDRRGRHPHRRREARHPAKL